MQVWWRTHLSFWHHVNGRYDQSAAVIAEARGIAERYGLAAYLFEIDHAVASALISKGDYAAAADLLQAMERRLSPARRMDWAYFHHLQANLEQRLGHFGNAAKAAEQAVALARETGLPSVQMPHFLARLAHSRITAGDRDGGMRAHGRGDRGGVRRRPQDVRAAARARADRRGHRRRATRSARPSASPPCWRTTGRAGKSMFLRNRPDLAARLANLRARARHRNRVRAHADRAQRARCAGRRGAARGRSGCASRALGGFELTRDGQPMRFTGKAQQRPLDLLKLLVALGGSDVDSQQLMAALWPDADGDAAKTSFDTTLFRLRKLLDVDNALVLSAGKLSLARSLAWTDVWALEARSTRRTASDDAEGRTLHRRRAPRAVCSTPIRARCWAPRKHRGSRSRAMRLRARFVRTLIAARRAARARGRLRDRHRRLPARARSRQPRRVVLSRTHALARRDRRSGRGAQRVPALPRIAVHRAGREAIRRNRPPVARNRGGPRPRQASDPL